jgi:Ca-activated chloride channel family protein
MKRVRYTKYNGDLASELDMEKLLEALSDYLLDSGFQNPMMEFQDLDQTMDDLKEALRRAMESGQLFDEETQEKIPGPADGSHGAGKLHPVEG